MHPLLKRQLHKYLNEGDMLPVNWQAFVEAVSIAYQQADEDRQLVERSLELMSSELVESNTKLRYQLSEQTKLVKRLEAAQAQLLQSEKMASIGQLAAGVAHEINNPVGYIQANLGTLQQYVANILQILLLYEDAESALDARDRELMQNITNVKKEVDAEFLKQDIVSLVDESLEGANRIRKIVQDLRDFSHVDEAEWQWADLHQGLDSTLNIVHNELKYKAKVTKEYGDLPHVECVISQLNQVFMNLLINAAHAIEEYGTIIIRTATEDGGVRIEIEDDGTGVDEETQRKIFDPFFTTKPVGKGTGLGLSLSYGIVQKHNGSIGIKSEPGKGALFYVWLPVQQNENKAVG